MNVVLSVGGSVLRAGMSYEQVAGYANAISAISDAGCTLGVVTGGGTTAREYIEAGRALGANEIELDELGIAITRVNARLLIAALGDAVAPTPAETYAEARRALGTYDIAVMGGTSAGHTTDAVSAALAEYIDAELLVLATSVPGVFDADPNEDSDARQFSEMTPDELLDVVAGLEMNAGSPAPVDLLAAKIIERAGLRTIVIDGTEPSAAIDTILEGRHNGTEVIPESAAPVPSLWPEP